MTLQQEIASDSKRALLRKVEALRVAIEADQGMGGDWAFAEVARHYGDWRAEAARVEAFDIAKRAYEDNPFNPGRAA